MLGAPRPSMLTIQKTHPIYPNPNKNQTQTQHKHPRQPPPNPKPHLKTRDPEQQKAQPIDIHRSQSIQGTSHHPKASTGSSSDTLPPPASNEFNPWTYTEVSQTWGPRRRREARQRNRCGPEEGREEAGGESWPKERERKEVVFGTGRRRQH